MTEQDFSGRTALVTGAASGIGAACAHWLDRHGIAELVLVDLDSVRLEGLELSCKVRRFAGDVSDPTLWDEIEGRLARLDHAVINAGIASSTQLVDQDFDEWKRVLAVNLDGAFLSLRAALRAMKQSGGKGSVVLTSSVAGIKAMPGTAPYGASKAAVAQLARIAAAEHAPDAIRVNAVAPGGVDTPIWDQVEMFRSFVQQQGSREAAIAAMGKMVTPLGRYASADEIAGQIGFLLSDAAWNITGTVLLSDGGFSL